MELPTFSVQVLSNKTFWGIIFFSAIALFLIFHIWNKRFQGCRLKHISRGEDREHKWREHLECQEQRRCCCLKRSCVEFECSDPPRQHPRRSSTQELNLKQWTTIIETSWTDNHIVSELLRTDRFCQSNSFVSKNDVNSEDGATVEDDVTQEGSLCRVKRFDDADGARHNSRDEDARTCKEKSYQSRKKTKQK